MTNVFVEQVNSDWNVAFDYTPVFEKQSKYQKISIVDTPRFGKVLLLDGIIQCAEHGEYSYHEMITHVPIIAHGNARSVLIIGGGDGGVLEEVLKHKSIETVTMVEIDEDVIAVTKQYIPSIAKSAFDDPRVNLVIGDAVEWVKGYPHSFDIIIVDRPDPVGPAVNLFTKSFYMSCRTILYEDGILVAQTGVLPFNIPGISHEMLEASAAFRKVSFYLANVAVCVGGSMCFLWASEFNIANTPDDVLAKRIQAANLNDLNYYNKRIHQAAFALPTFAAEL